MKTLILNNWPAKIACLVLASVLWFLIKKNLEMAPAEDDPTQSSLVTSPGGHASQ